MRTIAFASYSLYFLAGLIITTIGSVMPRLRSSVYGHFRRSAGLWH